MIGPRACLPLLATLLTGCAARGPIAVQVRDGLTHAPIAAATVVVRPVHAPPMHWPVVNAGRIPNERAHTDAAGVARLTAPTRHPYELFVLRPQDAPHGVIVDPGDTRISWTRLQAPPESDTADAGWDAGWIEARIEADSSE